MTRIGVRHLILICFLLYVVTATLLWRRAAQSMQPSRAQPAWGAVRMRQRQRRRAYTTYVEVVSLGPQLELIHVHEVRALHLSWRLIQQRGIIFDLVVFASPEALAHLPVEAWGCVTHNGPWDAPPTGWGSQLEDTSQCIFVPFQMPLDRIPEPAKGARLQSIWFLQSDESAWMETTYTWLMKGDSDCFLGPRLALFDPLDNDAFFVGQGQYSFDNASWSRIRAQSEQRQLRHVGVHNTGASWWSSPRNVRNAAALSVQVSLDLCEHGFDDVNEWPVWSKEVVLMYGQEMALNHLYGRHLYRVACFDAWAHVPENRLEEAWHVHAWQFREPHGYDKFAFQGGAYDNVSIAHLDPLSVVTFAKYCSMTGNERGSPPWPTWKYPQIIQSIYDSWHSGGIERFTEEEALQVQP